MQITGRTARDPGSAKRCVAANGFFEQQLLNFARQVWPETKYAAAHDLRESCLFSHRILLTRRRSGSGYLLFALG